MTSITESKNFNTIYNLDQMELNWSEFCNDDKIVTRVITIASRVCEEMSSSDVEKVAKFTQNLELLNGKYKEIRHVEPLTPHIQYLNTKLSGFKSKSSKTVSQFETASKTNSASVFLKKTAIQKQPSETPEDTLTKRFQNGISKLDINSPSFSQDFTLIQSDLKKLKEKGLLSEKESTVIEGALSSLKHGYSTVVEDSFLHNLAEFSPQLGLNMDEYENCKKKVLRDARSQLLKFIQKHCASPATLAKCLPSFVQQSKDKLSKDLVSQFLTEEQKKHPIFNKHFIDNFPALCNAYARFQVMIHDITTTEINRIEKEYDSRSDNQFSLLVKHYSYMDLHANISTICSRSEKRFIKHIGLKNINEKDPALIEEHLNKFLTWAKKVPLEELEKVYKGSDVNAQHEWLALHAQNIKKAYNQGDDKDIPGKGCCFNNCLDRFKLFSTHPDTQPKDIPMQSTAKGRFAQMRSVHAFHEVRKKKEDGETEEAIKKSLNEAEMVQNEAAHRLNLKISDNQIIITPETCQDPLTSLMHEMKKAYKSNHGKVQFLLALYGLDGAHVINIQFDSSKKIFRFIDDNLGICEFKSTSEFASEFYSYLNLFYKNDNHFVIKFFESK